MPVTKPRVIAGTIRPAGRDMYDLRKATGAPSATGGAPAQNPANSMAGQLGWEVPQLVTDPAITAPQTNAPRVPPESTDVRSIQQMVEQGRVRYQQGGTLSRLPILNRSIQEYTQNNVAIVAETKAFLDALQSQGKDILQGAFTDTDQMARWTVSHIMRSFEPGAAPSVPDFIHQSREGRSIMNLTSFIREAHNAGA